MRKRTVAREVALRFLYQWEINGDENNNEKGIQEFILLLTNDQQITEFAKSLIDGLFLHKEKIDSCIRAVSHNWKLERMAIIDRNIIRLGAFELIFRDDIPILVSINEAVDFAKRYSTRKSGSFVNGVLDSICKKYACQKSAANKGTEAVLPQ